MKSRIAACLLFLTGLAASAKAEQVTQYLVFSTNLFTDNLERVSLAQVFGNPSPVALPFSEPGDATLTVTVLAPRGKVIRCAAPPGFEDYLVSFSSNSGMGAVIDHDLTSTASAAFIRPSGQVPSLSGFQTLFYSSPAADYSTVFRANLVGGQKFTFRGIRFTIPVPAAFSLDIGDNALAAVQGTASTMAAATDPRQWIDIVPDPVYIALEAKITRFKKKVRRARAQERDDVAQKFNQKIKKLRQQLQRLA